RADADCIRHGGDKAEITATFTTNEAAQSWLQQRDLPADEDSIMLRRVITEEGRSRGYINGRPASATDLKELGQLLVDIHSQHAHQHLLQKEILRQLLDAYAGLQLPASEVALVWSEWQQLAKRLQKLQEESSETKALRQLLTYQVEELREIAPGATELDELEARSEEH